MSSQNVDDLFAGALDAGDISSQTADILAIPDLGVQMQAGMGLSVDDVTSSEVILINVLLDDSFSMSETLAGNTKNNIEIARDGVNIIIDSLQSSKQSDGVLINIASLNSGLLSPYVSIDDIIAVDGNNYYANGNTPLYDKTVVTLGQSIAKNQDFLDSGVACRSITVIISDGEDMGSRETDANDVNKVVSDMLATETNIVIGMGIAGSRIDFQQVFKEMGIQSNFILTPGDSESEIRKAFNVVSQTAVRASQGAGSFSQVSAAGFTN